MPADQEKSYGIVGYYQPAFSYLSRQYEQAIVRATAACRDLRHKYWLGQPLRGTVDGEGAWSALNDYLRLIETQMAPVIARHSHYYWLHLYRRIGVGLHPDLGDKRDARTTALVRGIMEAAFAKYARADGFVSDVGLSSKVHLSRIMNGLWATAFQNMLGAQVFTRYAQELRKTDEWVLTDFGPREFIDIYRLEALAYEYWLTTARMRRVGKGGAIDIDDIGEVVSLSNDDLERRIGIYDSRIERVGFDVSAIGVGFYDTLQRSALPILMANYNVERLTWQQVCPFDDMADAISDSVTNFIYGPLDIGSYADSHGFAEAAFRAARGFSLSSLCGYIAAVVLSEFEGAGPSQPEDKRILTLLQLYQRAYVVRPRHDLADVLRKYAIQLMDEWLGKNNHGMQADHLAVHSFLTLTAKKRASIGLWSMGPRYVFIEHGPANIIDLHGISVILHNAFFRVSHNQGAKGPIFEDAFRGMISSAGLDLLPERVLRSGEREREADALVRRNSTLFACECRAMERPLDFELGRLKTIETRNKDLHGKIAQSISLTEFIRSNPVGSNYDFSWAKQVVPLVVSPFVEWIWADGPDLWIDADTPRVLSAVEAVRYMRAAEQTSTRSLAASG